MKIIYLLPPSEGKNAGGTTGEEKLSFIFQKPLHIATNATEKDLKCTGKRFHEGIQLNSNIDASLKIPAIERYSGVMYNAIDYAGMGEESKKYFAENFFILSGMYGILQARDIIGDYKLPIETKGLYHFWGTQITQVLNALEADCIVDLLPKSYKKMIQWENMSANILHIDFFKDKEGELKKMTHGVKKVKGEYVKTLCQKSPKSISDVGEKIVQISKKQYHLSIIIE